MDKQELNKVGDLTNNVAPATTPAKPAPLVRVKVDQIIDAAQARKDSTFSLADISTAFQDQMGFRVHYGVLKAQAERQVNDLKLKLEAAESVVYRTVRDDLTTQGTKITEALLDREVAAHRTILSIKLAINEAKQIESVCKAIYEAIDDRKSMLMSAGARDRQEMEGEIRMNVAVARDANVKTGAQDMLARRNAAAGIA
jgi:hypothetical protein